MTQPLTNKNAIVTGAGGRIGSAVAKALAAVGARVAVSDINPDRAERVAAEIRGAGGEAIAIAADVANKFQCVHIVETTRAEWGRLDILVTAAAVKPKSTLIKVDEWDWMRTQDVNLKGAFFMAQLCGRVMGDQNAADGGGGHIIFTVAAAGVAEPMADRAAYCASQAGVVGLARECAREYAAYGIRVNAVVRPLGGECAAAVVALCAAVAPAETIISLQPN